MIFYLLLLLSLSVATVCGQVHIVSTCYNSEAMVTEEVMTNNADYSGVTVLLPYSGYAGLPYSIRSEGAGKSVEEEFSEFSHSIFAATADDFENIEAHLKTESGGYEWKKGVTASSDGLAMGMSVGCAVENGNLEASYGNTFATHTEEVTANSAKYAEVTAITPNVIASNGIGSGSESEFSHSMSVENGENSENIAAYLKTDSGKYEWKKGVKASSDGLAMGMSVGCAVENGNLEASYSNSIAAHTEELTTNGAKYAEATVITPGVIASKGRGNGSESEFSHSMFVENDETSENIAASLKTDSGEYEWKKGVTASPEGLAMGMSVGCAVEKGNLEASYSNSIAAHTEELTTNGAQYSVITAINSSTISSKGVGKSKKSAEDENMNGDLSHKIHVEGQGKWAEISTNLTCNSTDTDYTWEKSARALPQNSSLGMALIGVSKNGSVEILEMDGEASDFPAQHLPPGEVIVTIEEVNPVIEDLNESIKAFYEEFAKNPTALFYSIDQQFFNPDNENEPKQWDSDISDREYFQLGMSFVAKHP